MNDLEILLPPNWSKEVRDGLNIFVNDISGEETTEHPYHQFLRKFTQTPVTNSSQSGRTSAAPNVLRSSLSSSGKKRESICGIDGPGLAAASSRPQSTVDFMPDSRHSSPNINEFFGTRTEPLFPDLVNTKECFYDYHCQWTERDIHGDVSMYGLTIRYQKNGTTMIKFDGIDATWTYTALKGPYGCLEMHDLFIGAQITLFGRHLTISAANSAACKWISKEKKRLEKQQEEFRRKIESIGEIPCVRRKDTSNVKNITRVGKLDEQTNLRLLLKENARLGEQLAKLGLAQRL
jgi:hypothetical protein